MHLRFGRGKLKTPAELVTKTKAALLSLDSPKSDRALEKSKEDVSRYLEQMKVIVLGVDDQPPNKEQAMILNNEAIDHDLVQNLLMRLKQLDFETRKDVGLVVGAFLRILSGEKYPMADYFNDKEHVIKQLMDYYSDHQDPHFGLVSGGILREIIRHEKLARYIAESPLLLRFFDDMEEIKFEIAADAFATFKDLIVRHKGMISKVLYDRFDEFFPRMHKLITSDNFFIRRQTLKLLGEILCDAENYTVMKKYIQDVQNLMILMNLLRDKYESIQFEAFHAFKVFLIGDEKALEVLDILQKNKSKLIQFFENFQTERAESDEGFKDELEYVCDLIKQVPDP